MIQTYLAAADPSYQNHLLPEALPLGPNTVTAVFDQYWAERGAREYCASWFLVRLNAAIPQNEPIQSQYLPGIQRVLDQVAALPPADRAWTQLYLYSASNLRTDENILTADVLVASLQAVGPDAILRFLQRQPVNGDPDLRFDNLRTANNAVFGNMAEFIFHHATDLLRPADSEALLICASHERADSKFTGQQESPYWYVAAAQLAAAHDSAHGLQILRDATQLFPLDSLSGQYDQSVLVAAAWRIQGLAVLGEIVDWFYRAQDHPSSGTGESDGPSRFIAAIAQNPEPDTPQLLTALIANPRFEGTTWSTLNEMLTLASAGLPAPLVKYQDISYASPFGARPGRDAMLAAWRNLLRDQYAISGKAPPPPPPLSLTGQTIITQPVASVPLVTPAFQIAASQNGSLLALAQRTGALICHATTLDIVCNITGNNIQRAVSFSDNDASITLLNNLDQLSRWRISDQQRFHMKPIPDPPDTDPSSASPASIAFDPEGIRLLVSGNQSLAFYNAMARTLIWKLQDNAITPDTLVALTPDATFLAFTKDGGSVELLNAINNQFIMETDKFPGPIHSLALSPDGSTIAVALGPNGVELCGTVSPFTKWKISCPTVENANSLLFTPDGYWLAVLCPPDSPGGGERIGLFYTATGALRIEIRLPPGLNPTALAFSPDCKKLYTAGRQLAAWSLR